MQTPKTYGKSPEIPVASDLYLMETKVKFGHRRMCHRSKNAGVGGSVFQDQLCALDGDRLSHAW